MYSIANNLALSNTQSEDLTCKDNKISARQQVLLQHADKKGYATILRKSKKSLRQFSIPCSALTERIEPMIERFGKYNDVWISQNTFCKKDSRKVEDLYQFCGVYSDIDCNKLGLAPEQVLMDLEQNHFRRTIPEPNLVIFSGRGLQLIWFIEPESLYSFPVWQSVQDYIFSVLEEYGADPIAKDAARILRVAGTYNQKNHVQVRVYQQSDYVHNLTEIITEYILPTLPETPVKSPTKPRRKPSVAAKIKHLLNPYTLAFNRMLDMQTLIEMRVNFIPKEDQKWGRETLLFLYRYYACIYCTNPKEALRKTLELNSKFVKPLPIREAVRATRSAEKMYLHKDDPEAIKKAILRKFKTAGYNYKNTTLIKLLDITKEEQKHLRTIIDAEEKERRRVEKRRAAGMVDRETYLNQCADAVSVNVAKAKELKAQGFTHQQIADILNVSKMSVTRYLKK